MKQENNKLIVSWQDIERDTRKLAAKIKESGITYKGIVVIARGGLSVAALLSRLLDIKLIETFCISSYDHDNKREGVEEFKLPTYAMEDKGKNWLVVDDLIDSGHTYYYVKERLPMAKFAFLYNKSNRESFVETTIYVENYPKDKWIVLPWEIQ